MKYRKKPVVIEAIQYHKDANPVHVSTLPFYPEAIYRKNTSFAQPEWELKTLEGWHLVTHLDFIIKGIKGEFYPCKPDIFKATYVSAEDPDFYKHPEDTNPADGQII